MGGGGFQPCGVMMRQIPALSAIGRIEVTYANGSSHCSKVGRNVGAGGSSTMAYLKIDQRAITEITSCFITRRRLLISSFMVYR